MKVYLGRRHGAVIYTALLWPAPFVLSLAHQLTLCRWWFLAFSLFFCVQLPFQGNNWANEKLRERREKKRASISAFCTLNWIDCSVIVPLASFLCNHQRFCVRWLRRLIYSWWRHPSFSKRILFTDKFSVLYPSVGNFFLVVTMASVFMELCQCVILYLSDDPFYRYFWCIIFYI